MCLANLQCGKIYLNISSGHSFDSWSQIWPLPTSLFYVVFSHPHPPTLVTSGEHKEKRLWNVNDLNLNPGSCWQDGYRVKDQPPRISFLSGSWASLTCFLRLLWRWNELKSPEQCWAQGGNLGSTKIHCTTAFIFFHWNALFTSHVETEDRSMSEMKTSGEEPW